MIDETKLVLCTNPAHLGKVKPSQEIEVTCDECGKTYTSVLRRRNDRFKIRGCDLCQSCAMKKDYESSKRHSCFSEYNKTIFSGPWEKRYGEEKAARLKKQMSELTKGKNNPMYGKYTDGQRRAFENCVLYNIRGKTIDEIYGKERADEIRNKISNALLGEKNPMYGKPAPNGSGYGHSGRYLDKLYFRSLMELSFILIHSNEEIKNAEYISIPYEFNGIERTYHPDFLIGNTIYEIKANWQKDSDINRKKYLAATEFCEKNNYIFIIQTEDDIPYLRKSKIKQLMDDGIITLNKPERIFLRNYGLYI